MQNENVVNCEVRPWPVNPLPEMNDNEFAQWQALVEQRTGISFSRDRRVFLQSNLRTRMREIGCEGYVEYLNQVTDSRSGIKEWMTLVDRLTIQETRFYRDENACELINSYLHNYPLKRLEKKPVELWSVGCATGEEPYTLAMIAEQCLKNRKVQGYYAVTGTDISAPALMKARTARYSLTRLITLSKELRDTYLSRVSAYHYEVIPALKRRVCFARLNVLEINQAPMESMDIIFCQNLLLYFKRWRRRQILNQLAERLAPGGMLILGLGEIAGWTHPLLTRVENEKNPGFHPPRLTILYFT